MKRSEINTIISEAIELFHENNIRLPEFAYWQLKEWENKKHLIKTIKETGLGWDITDFGSDDFSKIGAVLFTVRNGILDNPEIGTPYAEKYIVLSDEYGQTIPMHYHRMKTEDIINRSGGIMCIQLYGSGSDGLLDTIGDLTVYQDGVPNRVKPGSILEISNGNSITLTPFMYHSFWAKIGCGDVIIGEVSSINDDKSDNVFWKSALRFAEIYENEEIRFPLVNDYSQIKE